jgi:3-dehydroquinate dehydratase
MDQTMTADLPDTLADTLVQTVFDVLDDHTGTPTGLRDALAAALAPVVAQHADNARADERERCMTLVCVCPHGKERGHKQHHWSCPAARIARTGGTP